MPVYKITAPDGKVLKITAPDGATQEQVLAYAQAQYKPSAKPNFGNVQARSSDTVSSAGAPGSLLSTASARTVAYQPGMGRVRGAVGEQDLAAADANRGKAFREAPAPLRALAGIGAGAAETVRGVGQLYDRAADFVSPRERGLSNLITGADPSRLATSQAREAEIRARDEAIFGDDAAFGVGRFTEGLVEGLVPFGLLAKGNRLRQIAGGAGVGAAYGATRPTTEEESLPVNTGLGALFSAGGTATAMGVSSLGRLALRPFRPVTRAGANNRVRTTLLDVAEDQSALSRANPSRVPGVARTFAEETGDPGIAQLQRQYTQQLQIQQDANQAARESFLRSRFGGASREAAEAQRDAVRAAQTPMLAEAKKQHGAATEKITRWLDRIPSADAFRGNVGVADALGRVRSRLTADIPDASRIATARDIALDWLNKPRLRNEEFRQMQEARRLLWRTNANELSPADLSRELGRLKVATPHASGAIRDMQRALAKAERGRDDVATLYETRKFITNELMPKALRDGDGGMVKALQGAVQRIDEQVVEVAPTYKQYLSGYRQGMREADRIETGANILTRGTRAGDNLFQPSRFLSATENLGSMLPAGARRYAQRPEKVLTKDQLGAVSALRDDMLALRRATEAGRAKGSDTRANLDTAAKIAGLGGRAVIGQVPGGGLLSNVWGALAELPERQFQARLVEVLADPQQARALLQSLPAANRGVIEARLIRAGLLTGPASVEATR